VPLSSLYYLDVYACHPTKKVNKAEELNCLSTNIGDIKFIFMTLLEVLYNFCFATFSQKMQHLTGGGYAEADQGNV
jgi:hypothetical protein